MPHAAPRVVVSLDVSHLTQPELLQEIMKLRRHRQFFRVVSVVAQLEDQGSVPSSTVESSHASDMPKRLAPSATDAVD